MTFKKSKNRCFHTLHSRQCFSRDVFTMQTSLCCFCCAFSAGRVSLCLTDFVLFWSIRTSVCLLTQTHYVHTTLLTARQPIAVTTATAQTEQETLRAPWASSQNMGNTHRLRDTENRIKSTEKDETLLRFPALHISIITTFAQQCYLWPCKPPSPKVKVAKVNTRWGYVLHKLLHPF